MRNIGAYRKICMRDLSQAQFRQLVKMEENCGLEPYSPAMLAACTEDLDTFACFADGRVVGFLTARTGSRYFGGSLYIVNLNVDKEFRGRGIAKGLMYAMCKHYIRDHGDKLVSLDVTKTNPAMDLYRKVGFAVAEIPSRNGDTDVVMAVPLGELVEVLRSYDVD